MSSAATDRNYTDLRPLVLFALAAFLFLVRPVSGLVRASFSSPQNVSNGQWFWLAGAHLQEGLYRLVPEDQVSAGLTGQRITYSTITLQADGSMLTSSFHHRAAPFFNQPLPINKADAEALMTIPGIGRVLAERIISLRNELGRFSTPEDILAVKGIGPKKLEKIRSHIVVD